jgi:uncharacterized protein (TIGR02145 family)
MNKTRKVHAMAHDVFISYATEDKLCANAACAFLERAGIRCWIAPRDVSPGREYAEEIVRAISQSAVVVLVFSDHANQSTYVRKEIERAISGGISVIPFRIEDVPMAPALELYLSNMHWLDAMTSPLEAHLDRLVRATAALIQAPRSGATGASLPAPEGRPTKPTDSSPTKLRGRVRDWHFWLALTVLACLLAFAVVMLSPRRDHTVVIGDQVWMAENLNVDRFNNGDPIPEAKSPEDWAKAASAKSPAWCYYGNNPANEQKYGRLYNWFAVVDRRGLAAKGYHVPTRGEWIRLLASNGGEGEQAYAALTASGSGKFNTQVGGTRHDQGMFLLQQNTGFWSSTEGYPGMGAAFHLIIDSSKKFAKMMYYGGGLGLSVRCLKGPAPPDEPESESMTPSVGGSDTPHAVGNGDSQALIDAIKVQDYEKVKSLLASGATPNSVENDYGVSPLELAVARGQIDTITLLLANGANIDTRSKKGATALDMAITAVNPYIVKMLVEKGADVNRLVPGGLTAIEQLSGAASKGPVHDKRVVELMKYLVDKGADISHDYYKAYFFALLNGNRSVVEFFLKNGVGVNARTPYGVSGLMTAASKGQAEIVKFLLAKGADESFADNSDKTALDYAMESHDQETIAALKRGGGKARAGAGNSTGRP